MTLTPHWSDDAVSLYYGDCLDVLRELADASVDSVVTDPPYGLEFMGKEWDGWTTPAAFQHWCTQWTTECLRVLKPGGHLLAFGGSRTWHRLACAVEDSGFEVRDSIAWLYGSGFPPKSLNVAAAIDRQRDDRRHVLAVTGWLADRCAEAGITASVLDDAFGFRGNMACQWLARPHHKAAHLPTWDQWVRLRQIVGFGDEMDAEVWRLHGRKGTPGDAWETAEVLAVDHRENVAGFVDLGDRQRTPVDRLIKAPNSAAAAQWHGWGTALKPAFEPIVVARKPLVGMVAQNITQYGTGALNIDKCRVGGKERTNHVGGSSSLQRMSRVEQGYRKNVTASVGEASTVSGRWPTNVVLDEHQAAELDRQSGTLTSGNMRAETARANRGGWSGSMPGATGAETYGDSGGASRFFPVFKYTAKAGADERPEVDGVRHPTVKPLDLMRWLVRLVTPPNGLVLDPFAGSGTTAEACVLEHFRCVAIEREPDYLPLIKARLSKPMEVGFDFGEVS